MIELIIISWVSREKPKMVKNVENKVPDNNRDDTEPEKKRARLDAEETTMIQKVSTP